MSEQTGQHPILNRLYRRLYPSIYFYANPLKIFEYRALVRMAGLSRSHAVLDLGCGGGKQTCCIAREAGRVVGLDPDEPSIAVARKTLEKGECRFPVEFVCGTVENAGLADESFDRIMSFSVIEHIPDCPAVLKACRRKLKPGGKLILSTDNIPACLDPETVARHRQAAGVARYFTAEELKDMLAGLDFADVSVRPILRSRFARKLFLQGMSTNFRFGWSESLAAYAKLRWHEALARRDGEGLFLTASATKPALPK